MDNRQELKHLLNRRKNFLTIMVESDITNPMDSRVNLVQCLLDNEVRIKELILLLNSESTVDVSASEGESDVLHGVVECNAERSSTTKINKEDVEGTLYAFNLKTIR
tara:strand:+ start:69 stop:389 length:321 start_codon:yes stop_codon:yes gene_type:complete